MAYNVNMPVTVGDLLGSGSPTITIDETELKGVMSVEDKGGMNAPEKQTEEGFTWTTHIDSKPLEVTVTALVPKNKYNTIVSARDSTEPVSASVAQVVIPKASVDSLNVTNTYEKTSHYEVTFEIREIRQPSTGTTDLSVSTGNGQASGSASSTSPSFVQDTAPSSSTPSQVQQSGGGGGGGNFVSDAIGAAADALGGLF